MSQKISVKNINIIRIHNLFCQSKWLTKYSKLFSYSVHENMKAWVLFAKAINCYGAFANPPVGMWDLLS